MLDVIDIVDFSYYSTDQRTSFNYFVVREMIEKEMMMETRPRFPSNKLSFTIANITKDKLIRYFSIYMLYGQFDVNIILEDSQRNFLSSFILLLICICVIKILK